MSDRVGYLTDGIYDSRDDPSFEDKMLVATIVWPEANKMLKEGVNKEVITDFVQSVCDETNIPPMALQHAYIWLIGARFVGGLLMLNDMISKDEEEDDGPID